VESEIGKTNSVNINAIDMIERPLLVMRQKVLFPNIVTSMHIVHKEELAAVKMMIQKGMSVIVSSPRSTFLNNPKPDDVYEFGVLASIIRYMPIPNNVTIVLLEGIKRVRITQWVQSKPYAVVQAELLHESSELDNTTIIEAQMRMIVNVLEKLAQLNHAISYEVLTMAKEIVSPSHLTDFVASVVDLKLQERQDLLPVIKPTIRLQRLSSILTQELDIQELQGRIQNQVRREIDETQREFFLREQLRVIQQELGEKDSYLAEVHELGTQLESLALPPSVHLKVKKELSRLESTPHTAPEVGIIRNYLNLILDLPWSEASQEQLDIHHAKTILNKNHYGLKRVKERILEYIAVRSRTKGQTSLRTPILCFVGPPGTGKTTLGRSIAEALGRKYANLSLGGMRDEAQIRGHRRTYIGAMPGRIIQTIKRVGTINPLIVLDEIDKIGTEYRGDPAAALLEVLDPEQNNVFVDNYLDLPYNLSQVLFIATANTLDTIPPSLIDRMEVIEFPGYIDSEKFAIATNFLIPRHLDEHALTLEELAFDDEAVRHAIRTYTYESGVRDLDRQLGKICRKVVRQFMEGINSPCLIKIESLAKYLGVPKYVNQFLNAVDEIGVATGLAWTAAGGDIVFIEVGVYEGQGKLTLTGKLGKVMQESAQAALSYTRTNADRYGIDPTCFTHIDVHIHVPEGAVSKDGPSAGVTVATALISAFSKRPVKRTIATTGEITLQGNILPVGGLRVKVMAAHRAGLETVVIPKRNEKDLVEIPQKVRDKLDFILADNMDVVLKTMLV